MYLVKVVFLPFVGLFNNYIRTENTFFKPRCCRWSWFWFLHHCCSPSLAVAHAPLRAASASRRRSAPAGSADAWCSQWPRAASPLYWAVCPRTPAAGAPGGARNPRSRSAPGGARARSSSGWTRARRSNRTRRTGRGRAGRRGVRRAASGRGWGRSRPRPGRRGRARPCSARSCCRREEPEEPRREYAPRTSYYERTSL